MTPMKKMLEITAARNPLAESASELDDEPIGLMVDSKSTRREILSQFLSQNA